MFPTMFRRRVDPDSFQPFIDLCVSINPERILDRMAQDGCSRIDALTRVTDEAVGHLKVEFHKYMSQEETHVQSTL